MGHREGKKPVKKPKGRELETDSEGKLSPAEAEAIMSSDLPSGDPELSPPAAAAEESPDYLREEPNKKKAA